MNTVALSDFRQNMSSYLEKVKMRQKPLTLGKRNKAEFVVIATLSDEDREMYTSQWFRKELEEARKQVKQWKAIPAEKVWKDLWLA